MLTGDVTHYTWYKDGQALTDGTLPEIGEVFGAAIPTLSISATFAGAGGRYWCVARNDCGSVTLGVRRVHIPSLCDPDLNADGAANALDLAYLESILGGGENPSGRDADFNLDGNLDGFDLEALAKVLNGGSCP